MAKYLFRTVNLQMFADGGAAAAAAEGGGADLQGAESTVTNADKKTSGSSSRNSGKKKGDLSGVVYGKQDASEASATDGNNEGSSSAAESKETDVTTTSNTLEARRAAFEDLIKGEYKDIFAERTQAIIDRRFKETKNLEAQLNAAKPVLDMMMSKYKIADGDFNKLTKAIETDDAYWEEAAEEAGLTVEQYKTVQKLERENIELRRAQQQAEGQRRMNDQLNNWYRQAEEVKAIYPDFDFRAECANTDFIGLLKAGIPVQKAYETVHLDELITGAATVAARQAEQNVVANIRNKASRPAENGTFSQGGATIKSDVSALTKADRAEIARRVARGEMIKF